jgi:hypothetical protein
MALSFAEALRRLEESRQHRAVWNHVVDSLSKFLDTEVREATYGIKAEGCVARNVHQDIISEIIQGIEADKISPLNGEIETLENLEVVETKKDDDQPKGTEKNPVPGRPSKAGSKKNTQRIRAVPAAARGGGE